jgi:membrane-associated phospholipid phosphatase
VAETRVDNRDPDRLQQLAPRGGYNAEGYLRNALISLAILLISFALVDFPSLFDYPLTRLINSFAGRSYLVDKILWHLDGNFTYSGVILVSIIWGSWFQSTDPNNRARLLVGTIVSLGAGICSRFIQYVIHTHSRPVYDAVVGFHPLSFDPHNRFHAWSSFPSDHATVFAGLVIVIYISRSRFRWLAVAWTMFIESLRIYVGGHYPTDVIAGAALAGVCVWSAQAPRAISVGYRALNFERSTPSLFYLYAFFISYQIATLFLELRKALAGFMHYDI